MIKEKSDPSECEAAEVRGSLPASIPGRSNERIGREVFSGSSGNEGEMIDECSMGVVRSPNEAPEPTRLLALRFRTAAVRSTEVDPENWTAGIVKSNLEPERSRYPRNLVNTVPS